MEQPALKPTRDVEEILTRIQSSDIEYAKKVDSSVLTAENIFVSHPLIIKENETDTTIVCDQRCKIRVRKFRISAVYIQSTFKSRK